MTMPLDDMRQDLEAEQAALDALVAGLTAAQWAAPTPSEGWAVRDQITHLARFDDVAALAITDPEGFAREVAAAVPDISGYEARYLERGRAHAPADLLASWRAARRRLAEAATRLGPKSRVPWYGPPMSAMSFLSARLMETWLHGHDITDALALPRRDTDRIRHILVMGVRTRGFSYTLRGLAPPAVPVHVELVLPSGVRWEDGEAAAENRIAGPAVDFCRVVTHRRHVDDTGLTLVGPAAREWMLVAQAFAGPPAPGRRRGQFPTARA